MADERRNPHTEDWSAVLKAAEPRALLESLSCSLSVVAREPGGSLRFVYANERFYELLGYTREQYGDEVDGLFELVDRDDRPRIASAIAAVFETGQSATYSYRCTRRDGALLHLRCDASLAGISDENGPVMLSVTTDVTALKESEDDLRALNAKIRSDSETLQTLMDDTPGGFCRIRLENGRPDRLSFTNEGFCRLVGMDRQEVERIYGDDAGGGLHPDDWPAVNAALSEMDRTGLFQTRCRLRKGGEGYLWVQVFGRVVQDQDGGRYLNTYYTDLSEQLRRETYFTEMLPVVLSAMMDSEDSCAFVKDKDLKYICCSGPYARMFGLERGDFLGKTAQELFGPEVAARYDMDDTRLLTDGKPIVDDIAPLPMADGAVRYLSYSKYPLYDSAGAMLGVYGVGRDVTGDRDAAARLELLTETIPGGIATLEVGPTSLRIVYCNEGFFSYAGCTQQEFQAMAEKDAMTLILPEDRVGVYQALGTLLAPGDAAACTYRCRAGDGSVRWFDLKAAVADVQGEVRVVNVVQFDVTERREAEEQLRVSAEQFRIAADTGGLEIARYDIKTGVYRHAKPILLELGFSETIMGMPRPLIEQGVIAPGSAEDYVRFFEDIRRGEPQCSVDVEIRPRPGLLRWMHADASIISDAHGRPSQAVIVTSDVTEQREKEAIYKKWQQSLQDKTDDSYTLFRCNISSPDPALDTFEGDLWRVNFGPEASTLEARTADYARRFVHPDDREKYAAIMNADTLLAGYYRGRRTQTLEYRELLPELGERWLRLTVELVQYPNSTDVEAFMMFENIDEGKKAELQARELSEMDPLTGLLNRVVFAQRLDELIARDKAARHALFMLDLDGFKRLNDTLGHAAGDQALIDVSESLRSILRPGDLLGRLGGDEFVICLKDVPYDAVAKKKAQELLSLMRKPVGPDVRLSASIGIAVYPRDGESFDVLYRCADTALYTIKDSGKDSFAFYALEMSKNLPVTEEPPEESAHKTGTGIRRRMLVVDDNKLSALTLAHMFQDEFAIKTVNDGYAALAYLRKYGAGVSVVLLDLVMNGMDGFAVLDEMRASTELQTIPVIVVSSQDDRETNLRAIRSGASDFVTKPVDPELVHLRVSSAISKAETSRLRAQNSYILLQRSEDVKYRCALESTGTVVIEYDWVNSTFVYDPAISRHIAGNYDSRRLWHILLSDMVTDVKYVKAMQELTHDVANDRKRSSASIRALLRTPSGEKHWFRMNVFKASNEYQLTDRLILTFLDINDEVAADEKLLRQAQRDDLTGLYNRVTFLQKTEALVSGQPANTYFMAVGDIDNFKLINDRYGHAAGDKLLQYTAEVLQADTDAVNGLCGRLSNDAFAVLLPHRPDTLQRLREYPRSVLANYPLELELTCSVGFYVIDTPAMPADGMLDRASMALQTVKGSYREKLAWYDEKMRQQLLRSQQISDTMEAALRDGAFDIFLQPQYNHVTGRVIGAEALVRWMGPERSVQFLPGEFINLFEKNGFITKLDEYVWNRTAELLHKWLAQGNPAVPVSVNVSRLDTHDSHLCQRLLDIVRRNDIPIQLFRLEITESLFEENSDALIVVVDSLHKAGFLIEMDDFGSGYSSLNILKDVPVDILKLDLRFFSDTENAERSGKILNAVMRMARWLDIPVIAEGVETLEQADYLAGIGCPAVQGYLYARPMPAAEFETLLKKSSIAPPDEQRPEAMLTDARSLWSPGTAESQLFDQYMGPALVFECLDGTLESLRANRRFFSLLGPENTAVLPRENPLGLEEAELAALVAAAEKADAENADQTLLLHRPAPPAALRCTLHPMPRDAGGIIILCELADAGE